MLTKPIAMQEKPACAKDVGKVVKVVLDLKMINVLIALLDTF